MEVFEYSNKGNRSENQDYVIHGSLPNGAGVYIVADGMGGYSEGAEASKVVANALLEYIKNNFGSTTPGKLIQDAIPFANDALMLKKMTLAAKKMGCVITIMLICDGYAHISWLGDSRIYMYRAGKEVYRTVDHSVINEMAKNATSNASTLEKYASMVTKSIMGEEPIDVAPVAKIEIIKSDVFVLCTDGFHKEINMTKALNYDESKKSDLDALAEDITDNYSFIKVII